MIDRRLVTNFDWVLLVLIMALAAVGVVNLYSAASSYTGQATPVFMRQIYWFCLGLFAMLLVAAISYHRLSALGWILYGLVVAALVAVLFWGKVVGGSQRWLALGSHVVQPSELGRLAVVLALAHYFHRRDASGPLRLRQLILPAAIVLLPAALILKQPDLGTASLLIIVGASIILANGVKLVSLGIGGAVILAGLPVGWQFLKEYQKKRIFTFLDPESDPLGASYHVIQSKIAVGSGQFWGKGFMSGTQSQLNFLPEQHTDFAFSVLAEEWGFVGSVLVIVLLAAIVARGLTHALRAKDRTGQLLVVGAMACVFWPAVINIGMVLGVFPVVGIPLPFISYGGSSMVTTMATLGLVQSVAMRRFVFHHRG